MLSAYRIGPVQSSRSCSTLGTRTLVQPLQLLVPHTPTHTHTLSLTPFQRLLIPHPSCLTRPQFTMATQPPSQTDKRPDSRRLADFAAKSAEAFVSAYYAASDSPQRTNLVPTLYLPNSSIVWNGTPVSGQQELTAMLNSMPGSKHEVQAFDCHAVGGSVDGGKCHLPGCCTFLFPFLVVENSLGWLWIEGKHACARSA